MNATVGKARVGQWYRRTDKGEAFVVTSYDERARTLEIQNFDGDVDEIDESFWSALPLELMDPPEDWTGPLDVDPEDIPYTETDMRRSDWEEPLEPVHRGAEAWQDVTPPDERDAEAEGEPVEEPLSNYPGASRRAG